MWAYALVVLVLTIGAASGADVEKISAEEVLGMIQRGEDVELGGLLIEGDLDISELDLPRDDDGKIIVGSAIEIHNSEIRGYVCFEGASFQERISLYDTKLSGDTNFRSANFSGDADFNDVQFGGKADFMSATFSRYADFDDAQFNGYAFFDGAEVGGKADFDDTQFNGDAYFMRAKVSGDADFEDSQFSGYTDFWDAKFSGETYFKSATFSGDANFNSVQFNRDADFSHVRTDDQFYFIDARIDGNLTLTNARVYTVWLANITLGKTAKIELTDSDITRLYAPWPSIKDHLVYNGAAYLALVKSYKEQEQFKDANDCYYQYRREAQARKGWSDSSKYWDILACISCGYGVRPLHTLILSAAVVLICAIYYSFRKVILRLKDTEDNEPDFWDAFYFSMMTFTTVGYGDWYPKDEHRKVVMAEGIVGWLLLALFLVTLARIMIP